MPQGFIIELLSGSFVPTVMNVEQHEKCMYAPPIVQDTKTSCNGWHVPQ